MTGRDRTLIALHRDPGATVDRLARAVYPRPSELASRPYVGATLLERAADGARLIAARKAWDAQAIDRTSGHLDDLVRRGMVQRRGPPRIDGWFLARMGRLGTVEALVTVYDVDALPPRGEARDAIESTIRAWAAMVDAYGGSPGVWRPGKSGAEQATYAALVERGVFVAPSQRWLTEAGEARAKKIAEGVDGGNV